MNVRVRFFSYFKDLTGTTDAVQSLGEGATVAELHQQLMQRFPRLEAMRRSTLIAVGLEYQGATHVLQEGDEISLFPPVQGG
jgi:molybdopterin converting factor small subunit